MRTPMMFAALLVTAGAAAAQQPPPPPACATAEYRQFDFWSGDWVVTDSAGTTTLGTNLVTREEGGCLLHEHWTGARGPTGQSFNFFDRATRHWSQVWVASSGNVLRLEGMLDGSAMTLEGDSRTASGASFRNRVVWTPEPDGRVRQAWYISQDGGSTWQLSFDGWYRRLTP